MGMLYVRMLYMYMRMLCDLAGGGGLRMGSTARRTGR